MLHETAELRLGVARIEKRSIAAMSRTLQLLLDGGLEIHHTPTALQVLAILREDDRPTAGGNNYVVEPSQSVDRLPLALSKARLAFLFEYVGDVDAGPAFDLGVGVVKFQP